MKHKTNLSMNIKHFITLNELIKERKTGSPADIAKHLEISERMVYRYIDDLKNEFNAPVKYDRKKRTYFYDSKGHLNLCWEKEKE
jgi:predicted DNA-binding transcriptional regulator YafY